MEKSYKVYIIIVFLILSNVLSGCIYQNTDDESSKQVHVEKNQFEKYSFYKKKNLQRYQDYQEKHEAMSTEDIITYVNMNRDYDFYELIIQQNQPNSIHTIVNKYYQLDASYEPDDLVEINDKNGQYGAKYSKHQARQIVYQDFQSLVQLCHEQGFELYVCSGYRSTRWQEEIYNHMVETYDQQSADQTCSRPGHSEHTTGLGLDIALDQYQFEDVLKHPKYQWFLSHLSDYGFIIRYPEGKNSLTGYEYEPWHIRYLGKKLAKKVEKSGLTFDEFYARNF
ncbi:MAG: D-alanyl-D-alanine carboxypeptidase family protein [Faecalibacillus sp.]